ncbi:MAG: response regulator [Sulfuritalea sp.]|nr:response regulator [Sulfuritalea sp.]
MSGNSAFCSISLAHDAKCSTGRSVNASLMVAALVRGAPATDDTNESILRRSFAGSRILVVEDNAVNRTMLQMQLEDVGLLVSAAIDGQSAVARAGLMSFDAILMDVQMPGLDGLEATRLIRKMPGYASTPVIAVTANSSSEARAKCSAAGMDDLLAKPFDSETLFGILLRWLSSRSV